MLVSVVLTLTCAFSTLMAIDVPTVTLNNGVKMPIVGYGAGHVTEQSVRDALIAGYRHIDTSLNYGQSEHIIGKVLKEYENKIKREDLFITSKLENDYHSRSKVHKGIKESLANLGVKYLDLYLIHYPHENWVETWEGMIEVLKQNLTRAIGVSNFDEHQLNQVMAKGVVPVVNQIICNPYQNQHTMLDFAKKHKIAITAWSPLGGPTYPGLLKDKKMVEIAAKHNVSTAQVALRFEIQRNVIVIPNSKTDKYIKENINVFGFKLTDEEMKSIEKLNKK
ncbi:9,11-endoperoxide prostaglandin H2 reductase-like [Oppia nitens]|uniref:9,11-endoperoxide prostaglandin H2 reductase-like n=1 Tax=Oppia nitens TaxID=1686743 RepID=UPI0023DC6732|nr:9,11-endoperoxide prostaglandin H2 reductase-like [Oppia nitens]